MPYLRLTAGILAIVILLLIPAVFKTRVQNYLGSITHQQIGQKDIARVDARIDSLFNYHQNGMKYRYTLLAFGSGGCSACRRMEAVLSEIRDAYPEVVQVAYYNILTPDGQELMKYYGLVAIPAQVLLGTKGEAFFRHTGYLPFEALSVHFGAATDEI